MSILKAIGFDPEKEEEEYQRKLADLREKVILSLLNKQPKEETIKAVNKNSVGTKMLTSPKISLDGLVRY